jgi:pilus assembly protein Flp/PilA
MITYLQAMIIAKKAEMDERGASAVEYGLLVAGIAALIVAVVFLFGGFIQGIFSSTCDSINASMAAASSDC